MRRAHPTAALLALGVIAGCGAKTGLLIPDADTEPDAGMDAGVDAGTDAGVDGGMCMPSPVELTRRGAQVMFVTDRSNSMNDTIDGERRDPGDPRPSRWMVLEDALTGALLPEDPLLEIGAKFYPATDAGEGDAMQACSIDPGIELGPAPGNTRRFLRFFSDTLPAGGTPTSAALGEVRDFLEATPSFVPRSLVLATDGGPNCNFENPTPLDMCTCTGRPSACDPDTVPIAYQYANCLDDIQTYDVVSAIYEDLGVPIYVIGIDDPMRPDLADVLDQLAILGGRPRDAALGGRRFYSIRSETDLSDALTTITEEISRCVYELSPVPVASARLDVRVSGLLIPRDPSREEGWDYTRGDRTEISLFGGACDRLALGGELDAEIGCPEGP